MSETQTFRLGEHLYTTPPIPPKRQIFFSEYKKEDQYWRRLPVPKLFEQYRRGITIENAYATRISPDGRFAMAMNVDDTHDMLAFREQEFQRRSEGVWFMNNGEPTYLTGGQYFQLQWCQIPDYINPYTGLQYGEYREFHRDVHYEIQLCKDDHQCGGGFWGKPKKTGITMLFAHDYLNESTLYKEKRFGMMSKSSKDCIDSNYMYYEYAYNRLPDAIKPDWSHKTLSSLNFGETTSRTGANNKKAKIKEMEASSDVFQNTVYVAPTKVGGFDGPKMFRAWLDEFPKFIDPWPGDIFKSTVETVKMGFRIIGKLWITSYVPESDGRNFSEAKQVWYDSKLQTKSNVTHRTISGLYCFFISALDSYEETDLSFDKYGKRDRDRARELIMAERKSVEHDRNQLQAKKRQYPIEEHEMWMEGGAGGSTFDNIRLDRRLQEIKEQNKSGQMPYKMGYFRWKDPLKTIGRGYGLKEDGTIEYGEVEWVEHTETEYANGVEPRFLWYGKEYFDPNTFNVSVRNDIRDRKKRLRPPDASPYCGATDPTENVAKKYVVQGSNDAITNFILPDVGLNSLHDKNVTDRFGIEYLYRHDNPDDYYEDLVLVTLFFSMPMYVEGNKAWVVTRMIKEGLAAFLYMRSKEKTLEPFDDTKFQTLLTTIKAGQVDVTNDIVMAYKSFFKKPDNDDEPDNLQQLDSERLIEQKMRFDPLDTKVSDLAMCGGLNLLLRNAILGIRQRKANKPKAAGNLLQQILEHSVGKLPEQRTMQTPEDLKKGIYRNH